MLEIRRTNLLFLNGYLSEAAFGLLVLMALWRREWGSAPWMDMSCFSSSQRSDSPWSPLFLQLEAETLWIRPPDLHVVEIIWNVMAHAQKPDFIFRRNGRVHLNLWGRQFSWLLAAEVCAPAVVMLDTPCSGLVRRVLATHSIRQFPLLFPSLCHRVPSHLHWSLSSLWMRESFKIQKSS